MRIMSTEKTVGLFFILVFLVKKKMASWIDCESVCSTLESQYPLTCSMVEISSVYLLEDGLSLLFLTQLPWAGPPVCFGQADTSSSNGTNDFSIKWKSPQDAGIAKLRGFLVELYPDSSSWKPKSYLIDLRENEPIFSSDDTGILDVEYNLHCYYKGSESTLLAYISSLPTPANENKTDSNDCVTKVKLTGFSEDITADVTQRDSKFQSGESDLAIEDLYIYISLAIIFIVICLVIAGVTFYFCIKRRTVKSNEKTSKDVITTHYTDDVTSRLRSFRNSAKTLTEGVLDSPPDSWSVDSNGVISPSMCSSFHEDSLSECMFIVNSNNFKDSVTNRPKLYLRQSCCDVSSGFDV